MVIRLARVNRLNSPKVVSRLAKYSQRLLTISRTKVAKISPCSSCRRMIELMKRSGGQSTIAKLIGLWLLMRR